MTAVSPLYLCDFPWVSHDFCSYAMLACAVLMPRYLELQKVHQDFVATATRLATVMVTQRGTPARSAHAAVRSLCLHLFRKSLLPHVCMCSQCRVCVLAGLPNDQRTMLPEMTYTSTLGSALYVPESWGIPPPPSAFTNA